ncbi:polyprotein, partial [Clonorchis sinensis]
RNYQTSSEIECEVWWTQKAKEMEEAQKAANARRLFQLICATGPRKPPVSETIIDRNGTTISNREERLDRHVRVYGVLFKSFRTQAGVRRRCRLSSFPFDFEIDEIMRRTPEGLQTPGVQIACEENLVDLEYATTSFSSSKRRRRRCFWTYKQENGQDIDQFVRKLKSLAKDCEFKSVSATEYQDECVHELKCTYKGSVRVYMRKSHPSPGPSKSTIVVILQAPDFPVFEGSACATKPLVVGMVFLAEIRPADLDDIQCSFGRVRRLGQTVLEAESTDC